MKTFKTYLLLLAFTLLFSPVIKAQPSGGPYGPMQQTYELPQVKGIIYYVSPDGKEENDGKTLENPTTIEAAFKKVVTGDAIVLRGGIYRSGDLTLNQGVTIQPYKNEQPILKGTLIANGWRNLRNGLWSISWEHLFPSAPQSWWRKESEGRITPLHKFNNDLVFVDGRYLHSTGWLGEVDENSFFIDYDAKMVYIGTDPTDKLVEITAFNIGIDRVTKEANGKKPDKIGPVIKGITITQYAFQGISVDGTYANEPAEESALGKEVVGTTLENCEISYCGRVGAWLLGDKLTMRHCKVSDTSTEGVYINCASDVLLEKNIFTRNNIEQITGYYPAGVKIFNQTHRVVCNDNLVIDLPYSHGVWFDVGNVDGVFTNNWVEGVGLQEHRFNQNSIWPAQSGFFFEISKGAVCAGNVFVNCDYGTLALNSCDVKVYNNTYINSPAGFARDQRSAEGDHFGWHPQTGPGVEERTGHEFVNNLCYRNNYDFPLLFIWQPGFMCERLKERALEKLDNNVYITKGSVNQPDILIHQKVGESCVNLCNTTGDMNNLISDYSGNSKSFKDYNGILFKGSQLGNYQLMEGFEGVNTGSELPDYIKKKLIVKKIKTWVGAYPETAKE
ncbi:MAG: right-handed parallel beta-helix repeat-containing protein [Prolixibacteraceae bacterium]|nr:right-handed parallel beta-helix repeat-containing protein [Prolixibacteraceae bacterium]